MTALKKLLVVDDDPVITKSFDRVLSGKGYAVITAATGEEALKKIAEEKYDAVFTDIKMPGISGIDVARSIKASQPWMPVVIITGYGTGKNQSDARDLGAELIQKPLTPEMIERSALAAVTIDELPAPVIDEEPEVKTNHLKNVLLFLIAPFIGLAYLLTFPLVGFAILATMGIKAAMEKPAGRFIVGAVAAPFITIGAVVLGPIAGLGALAWFGFKAAKQQLLG